MWDPAPAAVTTLALLSTGHTELHSAGNGVALADYSTLSVESSTT